MSAKIVKPEGQTPDEFELQVAQELTNLQQSAGEIKNDLKDLYITAAKQVDVASGRKAIVIFVPYRLHSAFKKIQARLVRELEKKFSGRHVVIIAQRTILGKGYSRSNKTNGPRPRSRTLVAVQEAILDVRGALCCGCCMRLRMRWTAIMQLQSAKYCDGLWGLATPCPMLIRVSISLSLVGLLYLTGPCVPD